MKKLYDDAVGWLKYAEAKNAALTAVTAGSLYASLNLAVNHNGPIGTAASCAAAFFLLALTMAVVSFLPITNPDFIAFIERHERKKEVLNLFFFDDLADLSQDELLERVSRGATATNATDPSTIDIAAQIIVNSQIARRKLAFFEWGAWLYISGLLTPVVAFLLFWISGGPARLRR